MSESSHPSIVSGQLPTADEIAQPRKRIMLPVSFGQWDRLKQRVRDLGNPRLEYVNYVVGAWGICVPCAISFLVYLKDDNPPSWALPTYGVATLAAAAIALIVRKFQKDETHLREQDANDIVGEMTTMEEAYLRGETPR